MSALTRWFSVVAVAAGCWVALGPQGVMWPIVPEALGGAPSGVSSRGPLEVVPNRPDVPGYERSCKAGMACVFGPAWSDDVDVQDGRNGCDQRSDKMRRSLVDVEIKPGTNGCIVARGVLHDPYTGRMVTYERTGNVEVVADHVVPLAAAWDLGASTWTPQVRRNFANDPRNLVITTRAANLAKGDKTPGEWMPHRNQCGYAKAYLQVATAYGVALTRVDHSRLTAAGKSCERALTDRDGDSP